MGKQEIQSAIKKVENPENEGINLVAGCPKDTKEKESSKKVTGKRNRKVDEYFEQKIRKQSAKNENGENEPGADDSEDEEERKSDSDGKNNGKVGYARQKVDQNGNSLKIEKRVILKKQPLEGQSISASFLQSKKKLKDKSI